VPVGDEATIRQRLEDGEYYEALGLREGAGGREVAQRVVELQQRYPALINLLAQAQRALTTDREQYQPVRRLMARVRGQLHDQFGPYVEDLLRVAGLNLYDALSSLVAAGTLPGANLREKAIGGSVGTGPDPAQALVVRVQRLVADLPQVDVEEVRGGLARARRTSHAQMVGVYLLIPDGARTGWVVRMAEADKEARPHGMARLGKVGGREERGPEVGPVKDMPAIGRLPAPVDVKGMTSPLALLRRRPRLGLPASLGIAALATAIWLGWVLLLKQVSEWTTIPDAVGLLGYLAPLLAAGIGARVLARPPFLRALLFSVAIAALVWLGLSFGYRWLGDIGAAAGLGAGVVLNGLVVRWWANR